MVGILRDPNYAHSLWGKQLYESLTRALREKRIPFCEIDSTCPHDLDGVFVIATEREWIESVLTRLNQGGHKPILLCNQAEHLPGVLYSCVCSDLNTSMKALLEHLTQLGKTRIALYGINTDSVSDLGRVDSLYLWRGRDTSLQVFANEGSLKDCFDRFFPLASTFDAVICPNDFAAVSLVRRLRAAAPETRSSLTVVSCSASCISDAYKNEIRSLEMNFDRFGRAAVHLHETLLKHRYFSELTVKVAWTLEDVAETEKRTVSLTPIQAKDRFYQDPEFAEMLIVEHLLSVSDPVEQKILECLLNRETTDQIAEKTFLSSGSVRYHIKRLVSESGAKDREHMVTLLSQYT
ncbi:MAG: winged helix-turn-helix transcriptional regulator [Oscillospiraceae bacterium]|nr:winged helix-turn-helix transcriptional regulator [Oscillospiraceae bacterium]